MESPPSGLASMIFSMAKAYCRRNKEERVFVNVSVQTAYDESERSRKHVAPGASWPAWAWQ